MQRRGRRGGTSAVLSSLEKAFNLGVSPFGFIRNKSKYEQSMRLGSYLLISVHAIDTFRHCCVRTALGGGTFTVLLWLGRWLHQPRQSGSFIPFALMQL